MATQKCHNTECKSWRRDTSRYALKNHCGDNWYYRKIDKCCKAILSAPIKKCHNTECDDWRKDTRELTVKNHCDKIMNIDDCYKQKSDKKENKNMDHTSTKDNTDLLEKQFEEEKSKDTKIIVKHCKNNLPWILLEMLLKDKAEDIKKYAMDLEAKEITAAENKSYKSGE